jgi:hypothetical protein
MFRACAVIVLILVLFALCYAPSWARLCFHLTFIRFRHTYLCSLPSSGFFARL